MEPFSEFRDGVSRVVTDASYLPVIIRTYFGATTEKLEHECTAWLVECLALVPSHMKVVIIADTRGGLTTDPKIRKASAQAAKKLEPHMRAHDASIIVIVDNVVLRSALVAISWVTQMKMIAVKDLDDAFREAGELLASKAQELPLGLTAKAYRVPATPPESGD